MKMGRGARGEGPRTESDGVSVPPAADGRESATALQPVFAYMFSR